MPDVPVHVEFRIRYAPLDGTGPADYYSLEVPSPDSSGDLVTEHPPQVGDRLRLHGRIRPDDEELPTKEGGGTYLVTGREWAHSTYGSFNWPYGQPQPDRVDLLVVLEEDPESLFPENRRADRSYPRWTEDEKVPIDV